MNDIFVKRLIELRTAMGLSQRQLAKMLNITGVTIHYWEKNQRNPDAEKIIRLAKFFNVSADYLLGLSDEK